MFLITERKNENMPSILIDGYSECNDGATANRKTITA